MSDHFKFSPQHAPRNQSDHANDNVDSTEYKQGPCSPDENPTDFPEDTLEECPVNPLRIPLLPYQVCAENDPVEYPEFLRPFAPVKLQNGRGKISKRKKKFTPRPSNQKSRLVLPKLVSSVDKFHRTPRGSPREKSYMIVSQQLSRLNLTDDHGEIEKCSPGESESSSRSSVSSCKAKLKVYGREANADIAADDPERTVIGLDNVQKECSDNKDELCALNIVSVTSASKVSFDKEGSHALPTDESGKCATMKDYLLDIAASQEDWTLWQKWKAASPDAFDFNTLEQRKADRVAGNVGALNKQLAFDWSHRPPRPIISRHKSRMITRKDPLPLSRAMKKDSLKNLKEDVVANTQLLPKVTGARYKAASTVNGWSMAHGVYRFCLPFTFG